MLNFEKKETLLYTITDQSEFMSQTLRNLCQQEDKYYNWMGEVEFGIIIL